MQKENRMQVILVAAAGHEAKVWGAIKPKLEAEMATEPGTLVRLFDGKTILKSRHYSWLRKQREARSLHVKELELFLKKDVDGGSTTHQTVLVGYHHGANVIKRLLTELARNDRLESLVQIKTVVMIDPKDWNPIAQLVVGFTIVATIAFSLAKFAEVFPLHPHSPAVLQRIKDASEYISWLASTILVLFLAVMTKEVGAHFGIDLSKIHNGRLAREFEDRISLGGHKGVPGEWPIATSHLDGLDLKRAEERELKDLAEAILDPPGHANVYEVDQYWGGHTLIPVPTGTAPTPEWGTEEEVIKVEFSQREYDGGTRHHIDPFEIRRRTTDGHITLLEAPEGNLWTPEEKRHFENNHKYYPFKFYPTKGRSYEVRLSVKGAFDPGHMDYHMHPKPHINYKKIVLTLDLRPMMKAGYCLLEPMPNAQFLSPQYLPFTNGDKRSFHLEDCLGPKKDLQDHEKRVIDLENQSKEVGVFRWETEDVRNGGWMGYKYNLGLPTGPASV